MARPVEGRIDTQKWIALLALAVPKPDQKGPASTKSD